MIHYNLSTLFKEKCSQHAEKPALNYPDFTTSYQDLSDRANSFAGFLISKGIESGKVVAIFSAKKPDTYALMLACLQIGVAYVNLDVTSPLERLEKICSTCQPEIIFADHHSDIPKKLAVSRGIDFFDSNTKLPNDFILPDSLRESIDGSSIAYIMFTSGSTGMPKGVAVTHQNVIHFIAWSAWCHKITPEDNFANLSPLYFDNSVFDFFSTFFTGASMTPISRELLSSPMDLVNFVTDMKCTIWFSVPSLLVFLLNMKVLSNEKLRSIRTFSFGGEGFPKSELKKLYDIYKERVRFVNVYGPTECTCICSYWDISDKDFEDMTSLAPLGHINPNFSFLVVGEDGPADRGELYLLGPNVAAGYYNDVEKTATAFGNCIYSPHLMKPQYKTGDLVKVENNLLYFLGRKDNQIKHMGYRIELEEIEAALNSIPGVAQSAALYKRVNESYGKILAYVSADDGNHESLESKRIIAELNKILPSYMIPNKLTCMDSLPKNPNGKVDRKQLAASS